MKNNANQACENFFTVNQPTTIAKSTISTSSNEKTDENIKKTHQCSHQTNFNPKKELIKHIEFLNKAWPGKLQEAYMQDLLISTVKTIITLQEETDITKSELDKLIEEKVQDQINKKALKKGLNETKL